LESFKSHHAFRLFFSSKRCLFLYNHNSMQYSKHSALNLHSLDHITINLILITTPEHSNLFLNNFFRVFKLCLSNKWLILSFFIKIIKTFTAIDILFIPHNWLKFILKTVQSKIKLFICNEIVSILQHLHQSTVSSIDGWMPLVCHWLRHLFNIFYFIIYFIIEMDGMGYIII